MSDAWREIAWVLLVKALLLALIWWLFFSAPAQVDGLPDRISLAPAGMQHAPAGADNGG